MILIFNKDLFSKFTSDFLTKNVPQGAIFSFTQDISADEYYKVIPFLLNCTDNYFYWNKPDEDFSFLGLDKILSIHRDESLPLESLNKQIQNISSSIIFNRDYNTGSKHPLFIGAIKFPSSLQENIWNDFKNIELFIPKILFLKTGEQYSLTINVPASEVEKKEYWDEIETILSQQAKLSESYEKSGFEQSVIHSSASNADLFKWTYQVNSALQKISSRIHKKVVLARYNEIEFEKKPSIFSHLKSLEQKYNNCYTFAYSSGNSIFFGASPEKLFKIENGFLETDALAGSIKRGISEEEDYALEKELLQDEKNLSEHKNVLDYILNQLTPLTEKILFDSQPSIKKFFNIQHLHSLVRAQLKPGATVISLIEKLFPTPAVCGFPKTAALNTIDELENFDRGLYAGTIGWFNNFNSEFAVGIRSAILNRKKLRAYAGCGIVAGSDPDSEFNETELKLKPILTLFANETINQY